MSNKAKTNINIQTSASPLTMVIIAAFMDPIIITSASNRLFKVLTSFKLFLSQFLHYLLDDLYDSSCDHIQNIKINFQQLK